MKGHNEKNPLNLMTKLRQCSEFVTPEDNTVVDAKMSQPHEGAYCVKCGKTATEGEYSKGECNCGGDIVAE